MCNEVGPVVESHLLPRALYSHLHDGEARPILVIDNAVLPTDKHVKTYLLCEECENVLSKGGETWVCPKLGWWSGRRFPLYDIIEKHGRWMDGGEIGEGIISVSSPEIDIYKITHFALGVFWKAGSHSWKRKNEPPMIDLGGYKEDIRLWLLDEQSFPDDVALEFVMSRPEQMHLSLNQPTTVLSPLPCRVFLFHALGALFTLKVGTDIPEIEREICFYSNPLHPILVSDRLSRLFGLKLAKEFCEARKTEAYLRARARRRKESTNGKDGPV